MDPLTAAVIAKMEEEGNIRSLIDMLNDTTEECKEAIKNQNLETSATLFQDGMLLRETTIRTYEKKFGVKWKSKFLNDS